MDHAGPPEVRAVDDDIDRLRALALVVQDDLGRRIAELSKRRNNVSPIQKLPMELAGLILLHSMAVVDERKERAFTDITRLHQLATVCTGWWNVVKKTPALWAYVGICHSVDTLALKLRKSGSMPLTVDWAHQGPPGMAELLAQHLHRARDIRLNFIADTSITPFRAALESPMPALRRLAIHLLYRNTAPDTFNIVGGPMLRQIFLKGYLILATSPALRGLTSLAMQLPYGVPPAYVLEVIGQVERLEELYISSMQSDFPASVVPRRPELPLNMPFLNVLELWHVTPQVVPRILEAIIAPNLTHIALDVLLDQGHDVLEQLFQQRAETGHSYIHTVLANVGIGELFFELEDDRQITIRSPDYSTASRPIFLRLGQTPMVSISAYLLQHTELAGVLGTLPFRRVDVGDAQSPMHPYIPRFVEIFDEVELLSVDLPWAALPTFVQQVLAQPTVSNQWPCPKLRFLVCGFKSSSRGPPWPIDWHARLKSALQYRDIEGSKLGIPVIDILRPAPPEPPVAPWAMQHPAIPGWVG